MKHLPVTPLFGSLAALAFALVATTAQAQTYDDLTFQRNRPSPFATLLQIRAGMLGAIPQTEVPEIGLEEDYTIDGNIYYRNDRVGRREQLLEVYAGRDGAYLGLADGSLIGNETRTRLELSARYVQFYREGFYRNGDFVPTGLYEGTNWEAFLGFGRTPDDAVFVEIGPFYKSYSFSRTERTAPGFTIPGDFNAFGARVYIEQSNLQLNRVSGQPENGYVMTLAGEREQNDSDGTFGVSGGYESSLPGGLWRGRATLDWYIPASQTSTWEIVADASLTDDKDRVANYDAWHPLGSLYVDSQLALRFDLGTALTVRPYFALQYLRVASEDGVGTSRETFFGGGIDTVLGLGDTLSFEASYSFINNESRPTVGFSDDTHGEHMIYIGLVAQFGATAR